MNGDLLITSVRCRQVVWQSSPVTLQARMMSPVSVFAHEGHSASDWWGPTALVLVEIETDAGISGLGSSGLFTSIPAAVIEDHFTQLLIGMSAFDHELIWSKLHRSSLRFGRGGAVSAAIAGVDIACYDAVGKALGVPVSDLLGGSVRDSIGVYASRLYAYTDLDELRAEARRWVDEGFKGVKQRFGFGPADGLTGMKKNEELVRTVRDEIGDEIFLAGDAYMGWDRGYAIEMSHRLEPYGLSWIEEPLFPTDLAGYEELCAKSRIPISHGEHLFSKHEFAEVIRRNAAAILQPDVNRMGFTEAKKVCALAEAAGLPVVPHSNEMHNLHLIASQTNVPFAEYFPDVEPDTGNELFWRIFSGEIVADHGELAMPRLPGLGIEINETFLAEHERHGRS